jgi:hypothetical protein
MGLIGIACLSVALLKEVVHAPPPPLFAGDPGCATAGLFSS